MINVQKVTIHVGPFQQGVLNDAIAAAAGFGLLDEGYAITKRSAGADLLAEVSDCVWWLEFDATPRAVVDVAWKDDEPAPEPEAGTHPHIGANDAACETCGLSLLNPIHTGASPEARSVASVTHSSKLGGRHYWQGCPCPEWPKGHCRDCGLTGTAEIHLVGPSPR